MKHFIFNTQQKDWFLNFKQSYQYILDSRNVDVIPIQKGIDVWVLPYECFDDTNFIELKNDLILGGYLNNIEVRDLNTEEIAWNEYIDL